MSAVPTVDAGRFGSGQQVQRVEDPALLAGIAKNADRRTLRHTALQAIADPMILVDIVKNADEQDTRVAAINRVEDPAALADIALNCRESRLRQSALSRIVDQEVLAERPPPQPPRPSSARWPPGARSPGSAIPC